MASIVSAPAPTNTSDDAIKRVATEQELSSPVGRIPAKFLVRMGKAATIDYGINWTTMAIIGSFHVGALAAFFFFSWQRLAVMAILYVLGSGPVKGFAVTISLGIVTSMFTAIVLVRWIMSVWLRRTRPAALKV